MSFLGAMFSQHPVRVDIAGTVESIAKINKETLYTCYNTFYHPSNMCLFVIGDVTPEMVAESVEKHIVKTQKPAGEIRRFYGSEPQSIKMHEVTTSLDVSVPMFMLGFKDPDCGYDGKALLKKDLELSVICEVLFGKTSPIYTKLYDGGYILGGMGAETACEKEYGYVALSGESRNPKEVRSIVFEGLKKAQQDGINEEDAQRVIRAMTGRYIKQFNNLSGVAHEYMSQTFNGIGLFDYTEVIGQITTETLNERLRTYFDEERSVLSVVEPR